MFKYLFVILCFSIIIYLVGNKTIEPIGSIITQRKTNDNVIPTKSLYLTNNYINYDLLDKNIATISRQYILLDENIKKFKMNIGNVDTSLYPNENPQYKPKNPNVYFDGSYPSNVTLNFQFQPPLPGETGQMGDKGIIGRAGDKGIIGPIGITGGNNHC